MPTSPAGARAALYALLAPNNVPAVAGITRVYDHEPKPGDLAKPVSLTIFNAGMTPAFYVLEMRLYVSTESNAAAAQRTLDTLIMSVDALMTATFGPSNWTTAWDLDLGALVATCTLDQIGREDAAAFG